MAQVRMVSWDVAVIDGNTGHLIGFDVDLPQGTTKFVFTSFDAEHFPQITNKMSIVTIQEGNLVPVLPRQGALLRSTLNDTSVSTRHDVVLVLNGDPPQAMQQSAALVVEFPQALPAFRLDGGWNRSV